uniref:Uncharacterized protein n=1 Tax=Anguilla anguilla TaxID=7936 RepID=A0A0E9UN94_ANGAN
MDRPLLGVRRSRLPITMAMIMSHGACGWLASGSAKVSVE